MIDQMEAVAAEEGLLYRLGQAHRVGTADVHRVLHAARDHAQRGELKEALLAAYMIEARNVADHDVLTEIAVSAGLDEARVREVLPATESPTRSRPTSPRPAPTAPPACRSSSSTAATASPAPSRPRRSSDVLQRAWDDAHPGSRWSAPRPATGRCGPDGCS